MLLLGVMLPRMPLASLSRTRKAVMQEGLWKLKPEVECTEKPSNTDGICGTSFDARRADGVAAVPETTVLVASSLGVADDATTVLSDGGGSPAAPSPCCFTLALTWADVAATSLFSVIPPPSFSISAVTAAAGVACRSTWRRRRR